MRQDGMVRPHAEVAKLTGLDERAAAWGVRLLVRRVKPSARDARQLTDLEEQSGWKYAIIATNLGPRGLRGVPGSHHVQFVDAVDVIMPRSRTGCARTRPWACANLLSKTWNVNVGWVLAANLAANLAADIAAWTRLLGLHDDAELARAEPQTLRYHLWHLPARLVSHTRRHTLKISSTWPWKNAFLACWRRPSALPASAHLTSVNASHRSRKEQPGPIRGS
ncbi:hypothetical protein [Nonomuraea sp. NPDC049028]|uniref:hypothetical protein n=1 Tax=Nonomuraea sp. NPDC049028 TaxID=3364348 RepID=UPI00371172FD